MRRAYHDQLPLAASGAHHPRAAELLEMGRILDTMTGELAMVCRDLVGVGRKADPNRGREGMTAEQALRAAIVKQMFTVSGSDRWETRPYDRRERARARQSAGSPNTSCGLPAG